MRCTLIYIITKGSFTRSPTAARGTKKEKNIPLQIESELTRWGTSLKAVVFYATHLTLIEEIILPFDPDLFRLHQQRKF
jgi:hypothetical protein